WNQALYSPPCTTARRGWLLRNIRTFFTSSNQSSLHDRAGTVVRHPHIDTIKGQSSLVAPRRGEPGNNAAVNCADLDDSRIAVAGYPQAHPIEGDLKRSQSKTVRAEAHTVRGPKFVGIVDAIIDDPDCVAIKLDIDRGIA